MTVAFLKKHVVAIKKESTKPWQDRWIQRKDKIKEYLRKLSDAEVKAFCAKIRALNNALKVTNAMTVYDGGDDYGYSGELTPSSFGIDWPKKKLVLIS